MRIKNESDRSAGAFWTVGHFTKTLKAQIASRFISAEKYGQDGRTTFVSGISIDSRTIEKGQAFIAIKGENFDGHTFIDQAFNKGATLVIAEEKSIAAQRAATDSNRPILLVENTIQALQTLASAWRDILAQAGTCVIAVAGSNGKTTTRRLLHTTLQGARKCLNDPSPEKFENDGQDACRTGLSGSQSPASFNNHLGTALTLLNTPSSDDFVVAEIGTNHPGEIETLAKIMQPDCAVITSIGQEHLEFFGSIKQVAREEAALLDVMGNRKKNIAQVPKNSNSGASASMAAKLRGKAFIEQNALAIIKQFAALPQKLTIVPYSAPPHEHTALGEKITLSSQIQFTLPLFGRHNAANAGAALALGKSVGIDDQTIADHLSKAKPAPGRFQILKTGPVTFINDAYNANPDSMIKSLDTFARLRGRGAKIAILGDMLELGPEAPKLHEQIGEHLIKLTGAGPAIDKLFLIGPLAAHIAGPLTTENLKRKTNREKELAIELFNGLTQENLEKIADSFAAGQTVLLKASRAVKLERIVNQYQKKIGSVVV